MPRRLTVKDKETGQTATVDWLSKSAPTDDDIKDIFAQQSQSSKATVQKTTPPPDKRGALERMVQGPIGDTALERFATSPVGGIADKVQTFLRGAAEGTGLYQEPETKKGVEGSPLDQYKRPVTWGDAGRAAISPITSIMNLPKDVMNMGEQMQTDPIKTMGRATMTGLGLAGLGRMVTPRPSPLSFKGPLQSDIPPTPDPSNIIDAEFTDIPNTNVEPPRTAPNALGVQPAQLPAANAGKAIQAPALPISRRVGAPIGSQAPGNFPVEIPGVIQKQLEAGPEVRPMPGEQMKQLPEAESLDTKMDNALKVLRPQTQALKRDANLKQNTITPEEPPRTGPQKKSTDDAVVQDTPEQALIELPQRSPVEAPAVPEKTIEPLDGFELPSEPLPTREVGSSERGSWSNRYSAPPDPAGNNQPVYVGSRQITHAIHGAISSTDQFLEMNPAAKPTVSLIKNAFFNREQWKYRTYQDYLDPNSGVIDAGVSPTSVTPSWKAFVDDIKQQLQAVGYDTSQIGDFPSFAQKGVKLPSNVHQAAIGPNYGDPNATGSEPFINLAPPGTPAKFLETNPKIVARNLVDQAAQVIHDGPRIKLAREFNSQIADPVDQYFANWYVDHYAGVSRGPLENLLKTVDKSMARVGARSVLMGSTKLQVLHAARLVAQIMPEVGVTRTIQGFANTLMDLPGSVRQVRESGLVQSSIHPRVFKTKMEQFDNLTNYMDIGNTFSKAVALQANRAKLKAAGNPNWEREAITETARQEGYVNPTSPNYFLEKMPRYFVQFKYWLAKYGENQARTMVSAAMKADPDAIMKSFRYIMAGMGLYEATKHTGIALFHVRGKSLLDLGSVQKEYVEKTWHYLSAGDFEKAALETLRMMPGGRSFVTSEGKGKDAHLKVGLPSMMSHK